MTDCRPAVPFIEHLFSPTVKRVIDHMQLFQLSNI